MSVARAERLVNLVLCLLSTRQYLSAEKIRGIVPGYSDAPSDEAFFRTFERDKTELRELGIPLEVGRNRVVDTVDGYRIARRDYELGEIDLEPDEAAAVALAVRLWDSPELTGAAHGALLKLRAAGVDVDQSAPTVVESKVRTTEPAFGPVLAAVQAGQAVAFDYRRPSPVELRERVLEPWGVVSWRGRWYVVGHDRDRAAPRCFRLSRIVGEVRKIGRPGVVRRPDDVDLMAFVANTSGEPSRASTASLWVAEGRCAGLRRRARVIGKRDVDGIAGELIEIDVHYPDTAAGWIAGYGADVLVLEPEVLAKSVRERLLAAAGGAL
ncbi:helix-turn-helix transcriptional regulator [Actinokineospora globicatena]|uniref:WYL domain-containing protein n=1 Tax=Actinokineospora globicatena TaxID=103729 RepID=A0A9W6QUF4_9PSEU|nr:WYL domain-containing protein [Actinokineospora globicatena]MCP2306649.1 transcriptional regulator [Actinokineospora globicatena]GLW82233.1 WYL domain-containing protein [Actinokineospora globicatena]GLW89026.1 WYL domain-containing protein [Actinokineospora globicatena]GLW95020.1 WYL domain-containing protein [Actinokineospora globicatena]